MDYDRVMRVYLKMRARRSEIKRVYEAEDNAIKAQMTTLENALLASMHANKAKNFATDAGTAYIEEVSQVNCTDWELYYKHLIASGELEGLEKRVGRKYVEGYMEQHEGKLPPGITLRRENVVRIRVAND